MRRESERRRSWINSYMQINESKETYLLPGQKLSYRYRQLRQVVAYVDEYAYM